MRLVTVAHGTRTPAGNLVAAELTRLAGERLGIPARVSYVELCEPLVADLMADSAEDTVVVPLLLSSGFHVRVDLPAAVASAQAPVWLGGPLGPDPLLAEAMVDRLRAAGARRRQPVVMIAAGSNDPTAVRDLESAAALLQQAWGSPVRLATLAGRGPRPGDVVRPGDAVTPYLLAPGFFARRAAQEARAAGADVVADVIGTHPHVVDLMVARAQQLAGVRL